MTMLKKVGSMPLALLVLAAAVAGCKAKPPGSTEGAKGGEGKETEGAGGGGKGGGGGGGAEDDDALGEKLNGFVECINGVSDRGLDSRRRYYDWLKDAKVGPTGKEKNVYGLYTLNSPERCTDALKKALEGGPKNDKLDAAGKKYLDALTALVPLINTANDYYDQKDYLDDKFAKAKEMHGPLYAAFEAFSAANSEMVAEFEKVDDELSDRRLAEMEREDGRNLPFLRANVIRYAKGLLRAGLADPTVLEEMQAALDAYMKAHQEMTDFIGKDPASTKNVLMWSSFEGEAKELVGVGKNRIRRVRDKKPYDRGEQMRLESMPQTVDGSEGQLIEGYNDLIEASNRLKFNFGQ